MRTDFAKRRNIAAPIVMAAILTLAAQPAAAAGFTDFFNNIVDEFNNAKQPLALIGLMLVGLGWLFNFVDLRRAGWVVGGIVLIYASTDVLTMITA